MPKLNWTLQYYCRLSCVDAQIQKINEFFLSDTNKGQITVLEIDGVTSNIFKLAEFCFQTTIIRYSFIEIEKYELVLDSKGWALEWSPDRKAKIIILENPIEKNLNEEDSPKLLAENLAKLNLENKSKFMDGMKSKSGIEEEVKNDAPSKLVNRKVSDDSGKQTYIDEETFKVKYPQPDILIRLYKLDIYQKNFEFYKFAPIQKLMKALFYNLKSQTVTLLSVVSDEQSKQNIMLENMKNEVGEVKQEVGGVKQEVGGVKQEVKAMKEEVQSMMTMMKDIHKFLKPKD